MYKKKCIPLFNLYYNRIKISITRFIMLLLKCELSNFESNSKSFDATNRKITEITSTSENTKIHSLDVSFKLKTVHWRIIIFIERNYER